MAARHPARASSPGNSEQPNVQAIWTTRGFLPSTRLRIAETILKQNGKRLSDAILRSRELATGDDPTASANIIRACELVQAWIVAARDGDEGSAAYGRRQREGRP